MLIQCLFKNFYPKKLLLYTLGLLLFSLPTQAGKTLNKIIDFNNVEVRITIHGPALMNADVAIVVNNQEAGYGHLTRAKNKWILTNSRVGNTTVSAVVEMKPPDFGKKGKLWIKSLTYQVDGMKARKKGRKVLLKWNSEGEEL